MRTTHKYGFCQYRRRLNDEYPIKTVFENKNKEKIKWTEDLIIGESKPVFVTESGIKLYFDNEMVKLLNRRIEQLNLKNVQAFMALHPDGYRISIS